VVNSEKLELVRRLNVRKEIGNITGQLNVQGVLMSGLMLCKVGEQILMVQVFAIAFFRYLFSLWKSHLLLSDYSVQEMAAKLFNGRYSAHCRPWGTWLPILCCTFIGWFKVV